ncbi:MAG: YhbY family RNA-binding protein [Gemmatimonadaceae bacterium]|nr:YhbY family RNA-binding protein [Gemmatimonadaceae bacterium]
MKGKERAELRAEAHHLDPLVHIGVSGATDAVLQTIDDALRTHELVKIAIGRHAGLEPKPIAQGMASALDAEVIQVIGRKVTLYRHNPDLWVKPRMTPPWANA